MASALVDIRFIENSRGTRTLVHNGYMFSLKTKKNESRYWYCVNRTCNAKVNTKNDTLSKISGEHNHPRDEASITAAEIMSTVRNKVKQSTEPVPSIFNDMLADTRSVEWDTEDVIVKLPTYYSTKASLYRHRSKTRPVLPKRREDVNLDGKWTETLSGERFLLADNGDNDRLLIFATTNNLTELAAAETPPTNFYQLYTIHAMVDGYMCLLVYALLPNKQQPTYVRFFTILKSTANDMNIRLSPEVIMMDYEKAAWRGVRSVFLDVTIRGCFFHYTQCIWRNVQSCGLVSDFKEDPVIKQLVYRAAALPLVPLENVDVWFQSLLESGSDDRRVIRFQDYVTEQWVESDRSSWNHFNNNGPRTTNHVEGWHHKINAKLRHSHPNVYVFIDMIKQEQATNEAKLLQYASGGKQRPRKRICREKDQRLIRLKNQLNSGEVDLLAYTDAASYLIKLG